MRRNDSTLNTFKHVRTGSYMSVHVHTLSVQAYICPYRLINVRTRPYVKIEGLHLPFIRKEYICGSPRDSFIDFTFNPI